MTQEGAKKDREAGVYSRFSDINLVFQSKHKSV